MPDTNLTLIRLAYDSYARQDLSLMLKLVSADVVFHTTTALPWGGTYRGHSGGLEYFRRLTEFIDATPIPEEFFATGDDVVVVGRLRGLARATGREFDVRIVHVWTVRQGQVTSFTAYIDTLAMLQALGR
jgi:ketosteroid isomerase-like protein